MNNSGKTLENVTFTEMTLDDIDEVYKIERASFPNPWSREAFYNELINNQFATYLLQKVNGQIVGYCGLWVIMDEAQITNIAVLPSYRNRKLGAALLEEAIFTAKSLGAKTMTLEVRVSNIAAQKLYKKFGFLYGGVRKQYYTDNGENAYVMWVNFDEET